MSENFFLLFFDPKLVSEFEFSEKIKKKKLFSPISQKYLSNNSNMSRLAIQDRGNKSSYIFFLENRDLVIVYPNI